MFKYSSGKQSQVRSPSKLRALEPTMLFAWLLYLICLLNLVHGSRHDVEFINDLMKLPEVNQCDFGYVYEEANSQSTHIENTIMKRVKPRYSTMLKIFLYMTYI